MKKIYVAPSLEDLGSVQGMTLANIGGATFDQPFGAGDPIPQPGDPVTS